MNIYGILFIIENEYHKDRGVVFRAVPDSTGSKVKFQIIMSKSPRFKVGEFVYTNMCAYSFEKRMVANKYKRYRIRNTKTARIVYPELIESEDEKWLL